MKISAEEGSNERASKQFANNLGKSFNTQNKYSLAVISRFVPEVRLS